MKRIIPIFGLRNYEDLNNVEESDFIPVWKKDDFEFVTTDPINEESMVGDLKDYAESIYNFMMNSTPMPVVYIYCDGELIKGEYADRYKDITFSITRKDAMTANVFALLNYISVAFSGSETSTKTERIICAPRNHSHSLLDAIKWMGVPSRYKDEKNLEPEYIADVLKFAAWTIYPDFKINGASCPETYRRKIEEAMAKEKSGTVVEEEKKTTKKKKASDPVIDVNPEELKPDDAEEKKVETPNAAPVVICLPMRDDTVEVKIPKTPPVKSGPEAATPDSVQLDPPKTVEAKVTEPKITNVQGMTVVENTDGTHIYAPEVAYDASVMYGAEIVNTPRPTADKLIAQNRAELRRYFLQRGLIRKTKKGYMLKHIDFNKKKAESFGLTEVLNRAYALQDQLRKMRKQCEVYITPREFLRNTAEDEATVEALDGFRKEKRLNFKDPNMMVPYLDRGIPNNYTVDIVCYDDAGSVFKPYCLSIDFLGCIEKYTTVNGQKVEGARIPQIFLGASLIFDGEEISNLYFGKEEENNCIIMKIPCTLKNIDSIFRQIAKGYWNSIEEDYPLMKDAKAPEREKELKQKAVSAKQFNKQVAAAN